MPFAASCSRSLGMVEAVRTVCTETASALDGAAPDLAFLFASPAHSERLDKLVERVYRETGARVLVGCTGESIICGDEEIEGGPALSLWCAAIPGARIEPFHATFDWTPDGIISSGLPSSAADAVAGRTADAAARAPGDGDEPGPSPQPSERESANPTAGRPASVFCLGEPFSAVPDSLIDHLADEFPGAPLLGGMASGSRTPGGNRLFLNGDVLDNGAVGVVLRGGPRVRSVVSQGCRPIGTPFVVTRAEQNIVFDLGGEPAVARLQKLLPTLPARDQALVRGGLHLGLAMTEYRERFERGDFLITNVLGADPNRGAIAVGNSVRVGQTVQFHVRDAKTADEDLVHLLQQDARANPNRPQAALLFSCNGRGVRLFLEPNHDAETVQKHCGPVPLAGFFAQGEFGPVGGRNYIHGYTASLALFE